MNTELALQLVGRARESITNAAGKWEATDLLRIDECLVALEQSAAAMENAGEILNGSHGNPPASLRPGVLALKNDVARMGRLVDAAAAFLRAVPGGVSPEYGPDGQILFGTAAVESRSMQA